MSTDSNLPISLNIPAITISGGGKGANNHSLNEWFDPTEAHFGPQRLFLTTLGLVGVQGLSEPLLREPIAGRKPRNDAGRLTLGEANLAI